MNRRSFLKTTGSFTVGCLLGGCKINEVVSSTGRKPNILVIITDDQGYADLSAYAHSAPDISTPNMDRLASDGVLFTNAYVTAPACSPARSGWNAGRYQQRWGMWGWAQPLPEDERLLSEYLKEAGYATGKFGKSDFGQNYHRKDVREYPLNHGFDEFLGFSAHAHDYFHLSEDIEKRTPDPRDDSAALGVLFHNETTKSFEEGYTTEIFTDYAIDFIKRHKDRPFFSCVSYNSVHALVHLVPERYLKRFDASIEPLYCPDEHGRYYTYYDYYGHGKAGDDDKYRRWCLANMACLDDNVGRLLDTLEELNLEEDTFVIFMTDNGGGPSRETGSVNHPLKSTKYSLFEGGIRIPMIMRFPGRLPKGRVCDNMVSTLDIVPTTLAAADLKGVETKPLDGQNLLPMLRRPEKKQTRGPLFWHFGDQFAVREGDWKLVQARLFTKDIMHGRRQPLAEKPELYNLRDDIGETTDLADSHPEIVKRLKGLYREWVDEVQPVYLHQGHPLKDAQVNYVSSEEAGNQASLAIDGNPQTFWHSQWRPQSPGHPHEIQIKLRQKIKMTGFSYLPRQDNHPNGRVAEYEFYISDDGQNWGEPVATGAFENNQLRKKFMFDESGGGRAYEGMYIKFVSLAGFRDDPHACVAEITPIID